MLAPYEYGGKEAKCEGPGLLAVGPAMVVKERAPRS